jgi:hypothetical protein
MADRFGRIDPTWHDLVQPVHDDRLMGRLNRPGTPERAMKWPWTANSPSSVPVPVGSDPFVASDFIIVGSSPKSAAVASMIATSARSVAARSETFRVGSDRIC